MRVIICPVCGRKVETSHSTQITCGDIECRKEHNRRHAREHYAQFGRTSPQSQLRYARPHLTRAAFLKLKAEIYAPIGDDEPLRRYVG